MNRTPGREYRRTKWIRAGLGIHAVLGACLGVWAIAVASGHTDYLTPSAPGVGVVEVFVIWLLAGWFIARARPMPSYHDQPEARFNPVPSIVVFVAQLAIATWFYVNFSERSPLGPVLFLANCICIFAGPLCAVSWLAARVRFHAGTWSLAWIVSCAGLIANLVAVVQRLAAAG